MNIKFRDIPTGLFKARVCDIKEAKGPYGPYLQIVFTIIENGELHHYRFSGIVKPSALKQSKFYRWVSNILGEEPKDMFSTTDMIGKECLICLCKQNDFYSVIDVSMIPG